jgi:hypothetical protein
MAECSSDGVNQTRQTLAEVMARVVSNVVNICAQLADSARWGVTYYRLRFDFYDLLRK